MIALPWPAREAWPNSRAHHMRVWRTRKRQREFAFWFAVNQGFKIPAEALLTVTFHPSGKRRFDLDNALAAIKGSIDGLAEASGVDDAGWEYKVAKGDPVKGGEVVIEWGEKSTEPEKRK